MWVSNISCMLKKETKCIFFILTCIKESVRKSNSTKLCKKSAHICNLNVSVNFSKHYFMYFWNKGIIFRFILSYQGLLYLIKNLILKWYCMYNSLIIEQSWDVSILSCSVQILNHIINSVSKNNANDYPHYCYSNSWVKSIILFVLAFLPVNSHYWWWLI